MDDFDALGDNNQSVCLYERGQDVRALAAGRYGFVAVGAARDVGADIGLTAVGVDLFLQSDGHLRTL